MLKEELVQLIQEQQAEEQKIKVKHVHDDERVIDKGNISFLNKDKLDAYILEKKLERPQFSKLEEKQIYELLSITKDGIPTLAAVMNFGIYPQGIYPQLAITAITVSGTEIGDLGSEGERFVDNKRIEGTISEMVEGALLFCKRNMKVKTIIDEATGLRKDRTEYPINAVREAILNAVIHRDYSVHTEGTPIQIDFFSDRLEIHSPGNLYGRMTVDQLGIAKPDLRNPVLAVMAESLTKAENRYSGIPTIRREMKEYSLPEPVFENRRNEFVVILYNESKDQKTEIETNGEEAVLLEYCKKPRSREEIKRFLKLKTWNYVFKRWINPLLEKGKMQLMIPEKPKSKQQKYYTK